MHSRSIKVRKLTLLFLSWVTDQPIVQVDVHWPKQGTRALPGGGESPELYTSLTVPQFYKCENQGSEGLIYPRSYHWRQSRGRNQVFGLLLQDSFSYYIRSLNCTLLKPTGSRMPGLSAHTWNSQENQKIMKTPGFFVWFVLTNCGSNIWSCVIYESSTIKETLGQHTLCHGAGVALKKVANGILCFIFVC